jgi:hypothetical protein
MAEDTTTEETSATEETQPEELGEGGKKALDAERKARAEAEKRVKEFEARFKEIEDRDKSEIQKAAEKTAELERLNSETASEVVRLRVAIRYQIAEEDIDLLGNGTEEQIEARAKRVADLRGNGKKTTPEPKRLKSGAASGGEEDGRGRAAAALRQLRGAGN